MGVYGGIFKERKSVMGCSNITELRWLEYLGEVRIQSISEDYTEVLKSFDGFEEPRDYNLTKLGEYFIAWK